MSEIDDFLDQSTFAARIANAGAQDDDPEQAARALELSDATGDPATAIYGDVDGYEKAHKTALGSQIISDNQFIANWLNSHPMAPRVAHDDLGALDETSQSLQGLSQESGLKAWLKSDSIAKSLENAFTGMMTPPKSFSEGFGDQPLGSSILSRPNDIEWAQSHPLMASVAAAVATPMEALARTTGGLLGLGHEQVAKYLGESWANELQGMAEWAMMRGDMAAPVGGELPFHNVQLASKIADVSKALDLAEPWTKIDKEPPLGLHPLIDDAIKTQSKDDLSSLDDALSTAMKSATRERAPDLFANFVRDHIGNREIGIDPEAVRNLYGDDVPTADDGKLGFVQDLQKQLEAAEITGDDVKVPLADWLAKVDPEIAKQLHDDIRVRDNGLTVNETKIGQDIETKPKEDWKTVQLQDLPEDVAGSLADKNVKATPSGQLIRVDPQTGERIRYSEGGMFKPSGEGDINAPAKPVKTVAEAKERLGYGTKTTVADPVSMLRGAGGFEPQFMAGDRKITLQKKPELAEADKPDWMKQGKFHDVDILDENGKAVGTINLSESQDGKQLWVDNIQAGQRENLFYQPNYLGPSMIMDMKRQLKSMFPDAETISGHRATGARYKDRAVGKGTAPGISAPVIKLQVPEGWSHIEPMRDLLNNFWQPIDRTTVEGLRGEKTLDEQVLSEAIRRELDRITPAKVGSVDTPISIRRRTDGPKLGGFHQRFYDQFPKIAVALDGAGSPAVEVARHEAIHHLRSYGFFSDKEWAILEKAAIENGWLDKYKINTRYPKLDLPSKLEEAIAEGYRHWVRGERSAPELNPIFEKLKELFEAIKAHFKELTGRDLDWDEIFKKVDAGEIGSREDTRALADKGRRPFDTDDPKYQMKALMEKIRKAQGPEREQLLRQHRDLYDRMAKDRAFEPSAMIEEPEGDEEGFGIYDRGKALGVTQSHMDRMLNLIQKRNEEDLQAANRRAEVRQRRRSNKEFKERRTALRDDVSNELQQRPDIALDKLFSKQKVKFNPAYLSEDQRARLPKDYVQKKDGINPDDLAPYFGYTSGDALVERLGMLTEDRRRSGLSQRDHFNRLVDVETDRRLNQEFGDREQNILDEAKDQALSETQLNLVHEETMAYAYKAHGPDFVPQFGKDQVRDMVRSVFNDTPVGSISSDRMIQTAGKIGKKIEEAGSKGDWATAYRLSQQRNHAMIAAKFAREYEKQRQQLDRVAKQFRKREVASVSAEYTNWIHDILQRVGYPINRSIQDLGENIARASEDNLRDFKDGKEAAWMGMRELPIADYLMDPAFRQNVDKLSYTDFMGLKVSIDSLIKAGRDEKKIITAGETMDREQALNEMRDKLESFGYKPSNVEPSRVGKWPRAWVYGLTNKETLLNRWDRGDKRGIFNRLITYPLADAANAKATLQREVAKEYQSLPPIKDLDKLVDAPFPNPMSRTRANPQGDGPWPNFKKSHVISMLMNAGNDSNWKVLAHGYGADPDALWAWLGRNVSKEDIDFAAGLGKIFKRLVGKADNVYERMTGATIEKIPLNERTFKLADGTEVKVPGWYHPLIADPQMKTVWVQDPDTGLWAQKAQGKRETFDDLDFLHFSTSNGYTKKRTGAIYPLDLNFNSTPTRIKQMIHDIAFREVVHEVQKIYGDPRFREDVAKYYGKEYADGLMPYLRGVAGSEGIASKNLAMANGLSELIRQNVISTYIGFNPFTVLKHGPTAAVMSIREVGLKDFATAVKTLYGQSPSIARMTHKFIEDNSEEIQRRERNWQDTIVGQGKEIEGAGNLREKIIQKGSAAVAWSDRVSAKPTWLAAYNRARADGLSHGESVSLGDRAVRRAHGSTAETNQPPLVQSGGPLHSWLTSVYGFFGTAMQRRIETVHKLNDAWVLGKQKDINGASRKLSSAFGDFMTYMIWPTIVEEAVQGIGTDDHRTIGSRIISGATMGMASSVIYLRDLIHGAVSGHEPGLGLASSALHDVGEVFRDVGRGTQALNRQHAGKTVSDFLTLAGESTGMSPKIVANTARYGINVATGQEKPKTPADVLLGVTKGTQKPRVVK